ncbi:MAG: peptide deformylase [Succinivibrio sp.]
MIKDIVKDAEFFKQSTQSATKKDLPVAQDLIDTINSFGNGCRSLTARMIGVQKNIIVVRNDNSFLIMFNPVISEIETAGMLEKQDDSTWGNDLTEDSESCRSITVEYYDKDWNLQKKRFTGINAQIVMHDLKNAL